MLDRRGLPRSRGAGPNTQQYVGCSGRLERAGKTAITSERENKKLEAVAGEVEDWAGGGVRTLDIYCGNWSVNQQEIAGAVSELLKKVPYLRQLRLHALPFASFNPADSTTMQNNLLLPHLSDLTVSDDESQFPFPFPQSVCFDLLQTSGNRISHLQFTATQWLRSSRRESIN